MKRIIPISTVLLLNACTSTVDGSLQAANGVKSKVENCPQDTVVSLPVLNEKESFYDRFNFHIHNIVADTDTLKFQTLKHDFVFCRGNNTWMVQPGTLSKNFQTPQQQDNPKYKTIDFQGKTYKYRVVIEPKFSRGANGNLTRPNVSDPVKDKVVFELLPPTPNSKEPQRQTLYTLKDLQQIAVKQGYSAIGSQLGFPRITAAVIHKNRIWWSVAFEQGEGNNGIGTIVGYEPQNNKFTVVQPQALWSQQITDLAITGDANSPTFWMGTNRSAEGTPYIGAKGLVAYRLAPQNPNSGSLRAYTVYNSPIVGAIPDKLRLENDKLWVGTANGVCQVNWQAADNPKNWSCWRFAAMAKLPSEGLPLYSELTNTTSAAKLSPTKSGETVEVLWWSPLDYQTRKGRYEVRYPQGFVVTLDEGASLYKFPTSLPPGKLPVEWSGFEWHWNGERFVRGFDEVVIDAFGISPRGIGSNRVEGNSPPNMNAIRGDLELLNISPKSTKVKYASGWVDETQLNPYLTVLPQKPSPNPQPDPLKALAKQLQSP
ncbi:hypothetical protein [Mastigocladopsis repens]|uniref:hypothetical protein n=1 Tax=Mastigocladopsis repens TaxID=221287 RepID=UPI000313B991|nr:hypothetical protein [Mastigocladopsis repens]